MQQQVPVFAVVDPELMRAHQTIEVLKQRGKAVPCTGMSDLHTILKREGHIDAIFIDDSIENYVEACKAIQKVFPSAVIFIMGTNVPIALWKELSGYGVKDFIKHPLTVERLLKISEFQSPKVEKPETQQIGHVETAATTSNMVAKSKELAPRVEQLLETRPSNVGTEVIVITSAKGGEGKSTIAKHIAAHYSEFGQVVIIDADSQGNMANMFRLDADHHITEIEKTQSERAYLDTLLAESDSLEVKVLPSPIYQGTNLVKRQDVLKAIEDYRKYYPVVIVDLPPGPTPLLGTALDYATKVVCVVTPDEDRLERYEEHVRNLSAILGDDAKITYVVNFVQPYPKTSDRAARGLLSMHRVISVPFDRRFLVKKGISKTIYKATGKVTDMDVQMSISTKRKKEEKKAKAKSRTHLSIRWPFGRRKQRA
jgi:cellulose biosynthesis protein BcsQ/DNA-binding NarL/FixJ family response regulator